MKSLFIGLSALMFMQIAYGQETKFEKLKQIFGDAQPATWETFQDDAAFVGKGVTANQPDKLTCTIMVVQINQDVVFGDTWYLYFATADDENYCETTPRTKLITDIKNLYKQYGLKPEVLKQNDDHQLFSELDPANSRYCEDRHFFRQLAADQDKQVRIFIKKVNVSLRAACNPNSFGVYNGSVGAMGYFIERLETQAFVLQEGQPLVTPKLLPFTKGPSF